MFQGTLMFSFVSCSVRFGQLSKHFSLVGHVSHIERNLSLPAPTILLYTATDGSLFSDNVADFIENVTTLAGFLQLNSTQILFADFNDSCLWVKDTLLLADIDYAGKCGSSGYVDGSFGEARFYHPSKILRDPLNSNRLFVSDSGNNAIRIVDLEKLVVSTLYKSDENLRQPVGMIWDNSTNTLIVSGNYYLKRLSIRSLDLTTLSGSTKGDLDGTLEEAKYGLLDGEIITLTSNVYLLADRHNNKVRMIDVVNNKVATICSTEDDSSTRLIPSCKPEYPAALLLFNQTLYVGGEAAIWNISS